MAAMTETTIIACVPFVLVIVASLFYVLNPRAKDIRVEVTHPTDPNLRLLDDLRDCRPGGRSRTACRGRLGRSSIAEATVALRSTVASTGGLTAAGPACTTPFASTPTVTGTATTTSTRSAKPGLACRTSG